MRQAFNNSHRTKANNKLFSHITSSIICPSCNPEKVVLNTKQQQLFKQVLDQ
jgi:hypothetical protein